MKSETELKLMKYFEISVVALVVGLGFNYLNNNFGKVREERILAISHIGNTTLVYTQEDKKLYSDNYIFNIIDNNNVLKASYNIKKDKVDKVIRENNLLRKLEGKRKF